MFFEVPQPERVDACAPKEAYLLPARAPPWATTHGLHVVHYSSQKSANHIVDHMNGTFLWKALYTEWLNGAAQSKYDQSI